MFRKKMNNCLLINNTITSKIQFGKINEGTIQSTQLILSLAFKFFFQISVHCFNESFGL